MLLPESVYEIAPLILKYLRDEITEEERLKLNQWIYASEENRIFFEDISIEKIIKVQNDFDENAVWSKIQDGITAPAVAPPLPVYRRRFFRMAVAASIVIFIAIAGWMIWGNRSNKELGTKQIIGNYQNDVAPGGNKATLTLASGSTIILDNAQNGTLVQQGNIKISKLDSSSLAYNNAPAASKTAEALYNTISTPRGGQYQVVLADGSKVWLNAASSLRFPVSFTGKERKVELTGEAYFEVSHDPHQPFKVIMAPDAQGEGGGEVEVLGTHFNINAYTDEREIKTTLLEGAVKIYPSSGKGKELELKPGEQAALHTSGEIKLIPNVDIDETVAWKNGNFQFNDASIETIMRQVARWYDVEIVYEGKVTNSFVANISRNVPISKLLRLLQLTNLVHFKIDGKKITVMQ